jgi:hypothetical protein
MPDRSVPLRLTVGVEQAEQNKTISNPASNIFFMALSLTYLAKALKIYLTHRCLTQRSENRCLVNGKALPSSY